MSSAPFRTADYYKVIASKRWREMRRRLLRERGVQCERCGKTWVPGAKTSLQLHHRTYQRLGQELDTDVQLVCGPCHESADVERAIESRRRSAAALYNAQLDGWARKVYGDDWADGNGESIAEQFDRWSESRDGHD